MGEAQGQGTADRRLRTVRPLPDIVHAICNHEHRAPTISEASCAETKTLCRPAEVIALPTVAKRDCDSDGLWVLGGSYLVNSIDEVFEFLVHPQFLKQELK